MTATGTRERLDIPVNEPAAAPRRSTSSRAQRIEEPRLSGTRARDVLCRPCESSFGSSRSQARSPPRRRADRIHAARVRHLCRPLARRRVGGARRRRPAVRRALRGVLPRDDVDAFLREAERQGLRRVLVSWEPWYPCPASSASSSSSAPSPATEPRHRARSPGRVPPLFARASDFQAGSTCATPTR